MKPITLLLFVLCCLVPMFDATGQITNLTVNGSSSNFTMVSGDTIRWEFDLPVGGEAGVDIWFDLNHDGIIQPVSDKQLAYFIQVDGAPGSNGPGDMDNTVNGHIVFYQPVGLAPTSYILAVTNNLNTVQITGTVQPLASPAHTISGRVTPPGGQSAQYILVELYSSGHDDRFWQALTNVSGDYAVQMNSDTSGNPWSIEVTTAFPPAIVSPEAIAITITGNHSGNNFTFVQAAAQVCGIVHDESGLPIQGREVYIWGQTTSSSRWAQTDADGKFTIGVTADDLINQNWYLGVSTSGDTTTTEMRARRTFSALQLGDSLYFDLTMFAANSQISGTLQVNGLPPGFRVQMLAQAGDSLEAMSYCDAATGAFVLHVTDKIAQYYVQAINLPPNYSHPFVLAQPGDAGVILPVTVTSVGSTAVGVPAQFSLRQNYPNPFNPSTTIDYDLSERSVVHLKIFNLLGQEIVTLVDGVEEAGFRRVEWNAGVLTSGVYFCRMEGVTLTSPARTFSFVRKLLLAK